MNFSPLFLFIITIPIFILGMENNSQPLEIFKTSAPVYHLAGNHTDGIYAGLSNSLVQRFYKEGLHDRSSFYSPFPDRGHWSQTVVIEGNELIVTDEDRTVIANKNDNTLPLKTIYRTPERGNEPTPETYCVAATENNYYVGDNLGYICVYNKMRDKKATLKTNTPNVNAIWNLKKLDHQLAASCLNFFIQIWDLNTNQDILSFTNLDGIIDREDIVFTKAYSNTPLIVYIAGAEDKKIKVLDTATNKIIKTLSSESNPSTVCVGNNNVLISGEYLTLGKNFYTAAHNPTTYINIWDFTAGKKMNRIAAHNRRITGIIDLGKDTIASSSEDQTIKIWSKAILNNIDL